MLREYDVAVIGAGPAGCITARELACRGVRVLLLEAKRVPRYKPCAGGLTGKTLRFLGTLPPSVPC
ncbi:FAD-dependent oxidoreductase [Thermodesulfitimonas sp.]